MPKKIDMIGKKFGRLAALEETSKGNRGYIYLFQCDCGNKKELSGSLVRTGTVKSCGCFRSETTAAKNFKHGQSATSKYRCAQARQAEMRRELRMPKWADKEAIRQFYMKRPEGYQVDHIIPLQGKLVSGLHVLENLQYLTAAENNRKHNQYSLAR